VHFVFPVCYPEQSVVLLLIALQTLLSGLVLPSNTGRDGPI